MNIVEEKDKKRIEKLYSDIREILLSKLNNQNFNYEHKQLYLPHERYCPGISENYYNEKGQVEFQNINGDRIRLEISRWHEDKQKNGWYNSIPCLIAKIYITKENEKKELFELSVNGTDKAYIGKVSDFKIPMKILKEKQVENIIEHKTLIQKAFDLNKKYYILKRLKMEKTNERDQKINNVNYKIRKSYADKIKNIEANLIETKKEADLFNNLLKKYSTFNVEIIGNAVQQLMNTVESDEYIYLEINSNSSKFKKFWQFNKNEIINVILKKDKTNDFYRWYEDSVILSTIDIKDYDKNITFYRAVYNNIMCYTKFNKFNYIKDFIDNLINYRFNNNLIEFTEKDILLFMKDYVTKNKDSIIKNYYQNPKQKILK